MHTDEPIAIAGIGCRFPGGADDADAFWKLMVDGVDAVTEVPPDRWSLAKFYDPRPDRPGCSISKWGGFVADPAAFDHEFFGISPREAASLDPQHRMLLLTAAEALTDACQLAAPSGQTRDVGVFVGISTHEFSQLQSAPQELAHLDAWSLNSIAATLAANRISFAFDLGGPSVAVDTACSSSLVAVHMACEPTPFFPILAFRAPPWPAEPTRSTTRARSSASAVRGCSHRPDAAKPSTNRPMDSSVRKARV